MKIKATLLKLGQVRCLSSCSQRKNTANAARKATSGEADAKNKCRVVAYTVANPNADKEFCESVSVLHMLAVRGGRCGEQ